MGNPNAAVKVVEFGSMTCPHCAEFDEEAMKPLTDNYVKTGKVSLEFRNFVRDPFDVAASLVARCGGTTSFFGLTRGLYADQRDWIAKIQGADQAAMTQIQSLPPQQQFGEIAKIAGFQDWAAMRGLPADKTAACLSNQAEVDRLVQMQNDAVSAYDIPGTPVVPAQRRAGRDRAGLDALAAGRIEDQGSARRVIGRAPWEGRRVEDPQAQARRLQELRRAG